LILLLYFIQHFYVFWTGEFFKIIIK
jgi:hypothetical protein